MDKGSLSIDGEEFAAMADHYASLCWFRDEPALRRQAGYAVAHIALVGEILEAIDIGKPNTRVREWMEAAAAGQGWAAILHLLGRLVRAYNIRGILLQALHHQAEAAGARRRLVNHVSEFSTIGLHESPLGSPVLNGNVDAALHSHISRMVDAWGQVARHTRLLVNDVSHATAILYQGVVLSSELQKTMCTLELAYYVHAPAADWAVWRIQQHTSTIRWLLPVTGTKSDSDGSTSA